MQFYTTLHTSHTYLFTLKQEMSWSTALSFIFLISLYSNESGYTTTAGVGDQSPADGSSWCRVGIMKKVLRRNLHNLLSSTLPQFWILWMICGNAFINQSVLNVMRKEAIHWFSKILNNISDTISSKLMNESRATISIITIITIIKKSALLPQ